MSAVLGIDAGGTKTLAALVSATGEVLSLTSGPGINPALSADLVADLGALLESLVAHDTHRIDAATLGLPYHGEVARITATEDQIATQLFGPLARACNDVDVAHIGAFAGGDGVLCLAGTGSMAWARGPKGTARAGGFGDLIGDEGSAFRVGQDALATLSEETDGRRSRSAFGTALAKALDIPVTLTGLMEWTYRHDDPRAGVASIARHVSAIAASGDADAGAILKRAAAALAAIAQAAARSVGLGPSAPLACAGSVFADPIVSAEVARLFGAKPARGQLPPVGGAALDAAQRAGWTIEPEWIATLRSNLNTLGAT